MYNVSEERCHRGVTCIHCHPETCQRRDVRGEMSEMSEECHKYIHYIHAHILFVVMICCCIVLHICSCCLLSTGTSTMCYSAMQFHNDDTAGRAMVEPAIQSEEGLDCSAHPGGFNSPRGSPHTLPFIFFTITAGRWPFTNRSASH